MVGLGVGCWAKCIMDIKEGIFEVSTVCHMSYVSDESLNSIPEIIITLYVN